MSGERRTGGLTLYPPTGCTVGLGQEARPRAMPERISRRGKWALLTLTSVIAAVIAAAVVLDVVRRAGQMRTATTSAAAVLQAPPGSLVKAVVRLEDVSESSACLAQLLEALDGETYRATSTRVHVALTAETEVVMGSEADVRPGAVVQVAGTIDREHAIRVRQIVILTGYIRVTG